MEEVALQDGGRTWSVRVLGRSARSRNAAPLLLLGFFEEGAAAGAQPAMEALVVGRRLADLDEATLAEAFARAAPPPSGPKRGFFQDTDTGRGRGREGGPVPGA
ncbi:MAG TPA: hypothetical protein VFQ22_10905 [Longimicrobiales bacterium]|nr:hypothetical protein [Longimicrobiales bacterium]